jgi:beta-lactamase class A
VSVTDNPPPSWRRRERIVLILAVVVTLVAVGVGVVHAASNGGSRPENSSWTPRPTVVTSSTPKASTGASGVARLRTTVASAHGHLAVAGVNLRTGASLAEGSNRHFFTASIEKVDIAVTLLRELAAAHRSLSADQNDLLEDMIEHSDNAAASALWDAVGGAAGINRSNAALGLSHTTAGPDGEWGLTSTTAADQLTLLRGVVSGHVLTGSDRNLLLGLMREVEADQRWGVSAAAGHGETVAIKDGWLPHQADDNRWIINSIGLLGHRRTGVVLVVLSNHHETESGGIHIVDHAAALAGSVLTG